MTAGEKLKAWRAAGKVSQERLARRVGVSRQSIRAYENGVFAPSLRVAIALERECMIDPKSWLPEERTTRIIRNAAKCLLCNTVIESRSVHDWVSCPCGALFVDGGYDYLRRGGDRDAYEELSEYA